MVRPRRLAGGCAAGGLDPCERGSASRSGSRQHRIAVPWIEWLGIETLAGFLVASSTSKLEMQDGRE